ncbi:inositol monophosphatase family protein [Aquipseudomonas alcaligenes]|uniref:inositol monophosphatase family protein n=1 Tax=Aquipseudomonas alcaligenes TaxID=43263 RepID=UPI00365B0563
MNCLNLLRSVTEKVLLAGELLLAEWGRPSGPRGCGDKAEVDIEIESLLRENLLEILNCDFVGEETGARLTGHEFCWIVDPNDGTADFLRGHKGSAISVGLLHNSVPVLGVVYAPVTADRGSDCISWEVGGSCIVRNGRNICSRLDHPRLMQGSHVLVSTAAEEKPGLNAELCSPAAFTPMPSIAYRLARVAAGDAIAGISLVPVSVYDVVGGHALLIGAGGVLLDQDGQTVTYEPDAHMAKVSSRCFGGSLSVCRELARREWARLFMA